MTAKEIWRRSPSAPDLLVSSFGNVMVVPHEAPMPYGGKRFYGGQPTRGQWDGNRYIYPRKGHKTLKVARLVCEAFNGPPSPGQLAMHEDENSRNNKPDNLRWGTQKENLNYPGFLDHCRGRTGDDNPYRKGLKNKAESSNT